MCLPLKPYKIEREWQHAGLSCAVTLALAGSHRCGYVRVPPGHTLHGKDYGEFDVEVHGGLTFAEEEPCTEHEDGQGWWFGFDCAHAGDLPYDPALPAPYPYFPGGHYWTQSEVERETELLADQLSKAA